MVFLRRLMLLVAVVGASTAGYVWWHRRSEVVDTGVPEWPPLPRPDPTTTEPGTAHVTTEPGTAHVTTEPVESGATASWVEPVDGACPISHPVKLNENSGIFHLPGGRFYDRTSANRCYVSAETATADGYRASKA